jgi:hypothetical protein
MELRIKHKSFDKTLSMIYSHWINEIVNKGEANNYIILEYPDIVQVVLVEPSGKRLNYHIADRRVAQKMVNDSPQAFDIVEINIKQQIASDIELSNKIASKNKTGNWSLKIKGFISKIFYYLSFLLLIPLFSKSVRFAMKRFIDTNINVITIILGILGIILTVIFNT